MPSNVTSVEDRSDLRVQLQARTPAIKSFSIIGVLGILSGYSKRTRCSEVRYLELNRG